jgi:hypothetical protein
MDVLARTCGCLSRIARPCTQAKATLRPVCHRDERGAQGEATARAETNNPGIGI